MRLFERLSSTNRLRALLIIASNWIGAAFSFIFGTTFWFTQREPVLLTVDLITGSLLVANSILLIKRGNVKRAGLITVVLVGAFFLYQLHSGGVKNAGVLWSYVFPIGAFFLLGLRNGIVTVSTYMAISACVILIPHLSDTASAAPNWQFSARFFASFIFVSFIAYTYEYARAENQKKFIQEIRERRRTERALVVEKEKAQNASRAKGRFVAVLSHELRTPLNGIIGLADLLKESHLEKTQRDYVGIIHSCAQSLIEIINDTLDYSKIEAGRMSLSLSSVDIREFVDELIDMFKYRSKEKSLTFCAIVDKDVPRMCLIDRAHLRQICVNLLGNAFKFTDSGEICLRVKIVDKQLLFEIEDTGPGIPPQTRAVLFRSFTQGELGNSSTHRGTGLGLVISKKLVELLGGQIHLQSVEGKGTTFRFSLPCEPVEGMASIVNKSFEEDNRDSGKVEKRKILVAEDNEVNRLVVRRMLEKAGYDYIIVENGKDLVEVSKGTDQFDLILMDIQMPVMTGYEACREIRYYSKLHNTPHVPIIALTATALEGDREKCLAAGMDDYVSKPIRFEELKNVLKKWTCAQPADRQ